MSETQLSPPADRVLRPRDETFGISIASVARGLRRYLLPIALSVFLLSPILVFDVVLSLKSGRGIDKLVLFALPTSVALLLALHGVFRRVQVTHMVLFPFYVLVAADLFLIFNYDARLTSSTISVFLENAHHGTDFLSTKGPAFYGAIFAFLGVYAAALYAMRNLEIRGGRMAAIFAGLFLAAYCGAIIKQSVYHKHFMSGVLDVISHDRGSPFGIFPQTLTAYNVYRQALAARGANAGFVFGAQKATPMRQPEIYVLVIGESSRRDHWSLFGYKRPTTPRLQALAKTSNLVALRNVVTQQSLTQVSVPLMLTRRTIDVPEEGFAEKSIISAFKEAGFLTYWLSTQQRDQWTGAINRYTAEADQVSFFERRHDGVLVKAMKEAIAEGTRAGRNLFFVLHTQGSHFVFRDRYPSDTQPFRPEGTPAEKMIAEYDNSIEYTDRVLSEVIDALRAGGGTSGMLYVADHGENLYDDRRGLFGHMLNNEYDMPIPVVLWLSDSYIEQAPAKLRAARKHVDAPLSTRGVFYTLADLGGLQLPDKRAAAESILSERMQTFPRLFRKGDRIIDYDEWERTERKTQ